MLERAKSVVMRARHFVTRSREGLSQSDVAEARQYIISFWPKLERYHPKDDETLLGLPHTYLVPAYERGHSFDFNEMYYWDSYFMVQGMLDKPHQHLVTGILDDLLALQKRFNIIPNASRTYLMGRSQPPLLTTFIFDIYDTYDPGQAWLHNAIEQAKQEYHTVWMGTSKPNERLVYRGLSRYYDINYLHDLAETESGWDMTPRFSRKCLHYLPVDLNALLYKYEIDFARAAHLMGNHKVSRQWELAATHRKRVMNELMWSKARGLYYDYNFYKQKRGTVSSLASYYPLWAGMVDDRQAFQLVKNLRKFEQKGGLSATDQQLGQLVPGSIPTQWAYPNGWAPLHFLIVQGLQRYGYHAEAKRIGLKWLQTNLDWFNKNRVFLEKYNVVNPDKPPTKGIYPSQTGFGWTNAIFERFCQEFID
jgi:alpha,alpha-trehalase